MKQFEAIILTAGYSSRMGTDKALVKYQGKTFLEHLVEKIAPRAGCINFILGHHCSIIEDFIREKFHNINYQTIFNSRYPDGMFTSIRCGFDNISGKYPVLLQMIDQPFIAPETYQQLIDHYDQSMLILQPADETGRKGHPILFHHSFSALLKKHPEAETLRDMMSIYYPQKHYLVVDDGGIFQNINSPDLIKE